MFKNLFLGLLFFCLTFTLGVVNSIKFDSKKCSATADNIYDYSIYGVREYFNDTYSNDEKKYLYSSENTNSKKIIANVKNFNQIELNRSYYRNTNTNISGSCTIVACLGLLNYFGNEKGEFAINDTYSKAFIKIFNACLEAGYTSTNNGTDMSDEDNCVDIAFNTYGSSREGNINWWYLYDNICDAVDCNSPIIFDLTDHSTVAIGVTEFYVTYEETYTTGMWWWKKEEKRTVTDIIEFVIVNDGWGTNNGSLVPVSMITNIWGNMQVCWAEL